MPTIIHPLTDDAICIHVPVLLCDEAFLDDEMLRDGYIISTISLN